MTCAVLLAIPAIAFADNVQTNDVDTGGNATKEVGASGNASVRIVGNNAPSGDISNCNVDADNPATVGFTVSQPSKLTIGSAQVTACGNDGLKSVAYQVTSSAQAGDVITVTTSTTGGKTGSKWNESSFTVTVTAPSTPADTTPPVLTLPSNITAEATGPDGATVTYSASAEDAVDGPVEIICTPASGATFELGTTTVNCSASDAAGNTANGSFTVTVRDTTAPVIAAHDNVIAEATGPDGAAVSYTSPATTDAVDGNGTANCTPASDSTFALGDTTVTCTAEDAAGNQATDTTFTVTVRDTTGPALNLPADITTTATSNSQATVNFTATANDLVDGSRPVSCDPASGSSFSAGTTTVNCSSSDSRGNTSNGSFTVTVNYAWTGFFQPVDNPGVFNKVKIGSTVPVKFSLGGNQGLSIFFSSAYPQVSKPITCGVNPAVDTLEEYAPTGTNSGLKYDATANQYIYNWKTDGYKAGECRSLIVKLADGSVKTANFTFFK
jgi:hypothetical protein